MGNVVKCSYHFDSSAITDIKEVNDSFALGTLYVMYTGGNPNGTKFEHDVVEDAIPTLANVPIVCNYNADDKEIGGHDFTVVSEDDGSLRLRALTVPCGVVTDHSKASFVTMEDSNGVEREYLKVDNVVLWKRQEVVQYILNDLDGVVDHSMEIDVTDGEKQDDGYYNIKKFQFTALCLLGNATPCFNGSKLEMYSSENIKDGIANMMDDIQKNYSAIVAAVNGGDDNNSDSKGGENMDGMNKIPESTEPVVETAPEEQNEEPTAMQFELNGNIEESLRKAVYEPKTIRWGEEYCLYYFVDFDADLGVVYAEERGTGNLYGFPYKMDGDVAVVDFENGARKKRAFADFVEGDAANLYSEQRSEAAAEAEQMYADLTAKCSELEAKVTEYSEQITAMQTELDSLREFKANADAEAATEAREAVFAQFTDLAGVEAFDSLKENCAEMAIADIEEKCYAIRGRMVASASTTYSAAQKKATLKVVLDDCQEDATEDKNVELPYGGLVEKYTNK